MHFDPITWTVIDGDVNTLVPQLAVPSTLRVWRVPADYKADEVFVSVQPLGAPEELPACDLRQCVKVLEQQIDAHPLAALAELKIAKKRQIEADRDAEAMASVSALGHLWQADMRSQDLLAKAITLAQAGLPLPPIWRDADNNDVPIASLADLLAIAGAIGQQTQQAYARSWARKAAVDAATTPEEVEEA